MEITSGKNVITSVFVGYLASVGITEQTILDAFNDPKNTNWDAIGVSVGALSKKLYEDVIWFSGEPMDAMKSGISDAFEGTEAKERYVKMVTLPERVQYKIENGLPIIDRR